MLSNLDTLAHCTWFGKLHVQRQCSAWSGWQVRASRTWATANSRASRSTLRSRRSPAHCTARRRTRWSSLSAHYNTSHVCLLPRYMLLYFGTYLQTYTLLYFTLHYTTYLSGNCCSFTCYICKSRCGAQVAQIFELVCSVCTGLDMRLAMMMIFRPELVAGIMRVLEACVRCFAPCYFQVRIFVHSLRVNH